MARRFTFHPHEILEWGPLEPLVTLRGSPEARWLGPPLQRIPWTVVRRAKSQGAQTLVVEEVQGREDPEVRGTEPWLYYQPDAALLFTTYLGCRAQIGLQNRSC